MTPDTQPTVVVVECKVQFITEEGLSPVLAIPPHMMPAECVASHSVCNHQAWSYCWATGTEVHSMQAVPDALPANVHISGCPQLPPYGAGRGSSGLSLDEVVFTVCRLLGVSRPASFLNPPCDE